MNTNAVDVTIAAGNESTRLQLPIEVVRSRPCKVVVLDEDTDEQVPARVYLTDPLGPSWPEGSIIKADEHGNAFFHTEGAFEARVSGEGKLVITRGMEHEPTDLTISESDGGNERVVARMRRWSNMAREAWRSGDVHVHLHYGGEYLFDPQYASLVQRGEDVHFMNMMVANQGSGFVHDRDLFEGRPNAFSDADHILRWGEEYRNDFYGHLCMYGIEELVPPIYSGFRLSEHPDDLPANAVAADRCHSIGGTLSYAHPLFGSGDLERVFERARTVEAKELPVDVALGKIDALDVMSYPSVDLEVSELWYKLLNCGFRVPATAGTDTFMNVCGTGIFSNPPAGNRVFAQIDGEFTTEAWCEAVRRGRTFVTNGPMMALSIDGHGIGAEIQARAGAVLRVSGEAKSWAPMDRLELIVNGEVVTSVDTTDPRLAQLEHRLNVERSCWVALRALGAENSLVLGGPVFAHTSPIYVLVEDAPIGDGGAASYFVDWIERLITTCREQGRYSSPTEMENVVRLFRSAQDYYNGLR